MGVCERDVEVVFALDVINEKCGLSPRRYASKPFWVIVFKGAKGIGFFFWGSNEESFWVIPQAEPCRVDSERVAFTLPAFL